MYRGQVHTTGVQMSGVHNRCLEVRCTQEVYKGQVYTTGIEVRCNGSERSHSSLVKKTFPTLHSVQTQNQVYKEEDKHIGCFASQTTQLRRVSRWCIVQYANTGVECHTTWWLVLGAITNGAEQVLWLQKSHPVKVFFFWWGGSASKQDALLQKQWLTGLTTQQSTCVEVYGS